MPIKKRSVLPTSEPEPVTKGPLIIVAKPKQPMPAANIADSISPLRLGLVAQVCGDLQPDAKFNVADRVRLLRTPYDKNSPQEQRYRNRVKNRATAITAMCITCTGSRKGVTECMATSCPLWGFRMGGDPFRGKRGK